jgi:tetratricopeptide (TPR) repeat protein
MNGAEGQSKRPRLIALALAVVTLLLYLPAWFHDWIYFDDPAYVLDNEIVRAGLTWAGIKWAFIGWHASNWHPLTWMSHMLDAQLFGLNPAGHHFVNVLFHAANAALLFLLWHQMTRALWRSAIVAALFAWHPLHVESVAWIAERKDVLSTFFGLLSLLAYVAYTDKSALRTPRSAVSYVWSLVCFALGLLAKPMLVTLPFVMLLLDWWPLKRMPCSSAKATEDGGATGCWLPRLLLEKSPFFLLSSISCIITFLAQRGQAVISLKHYSLALRLENVLVSYARYLFKTFLPINLSVFYPLQSHIAIGEVILAAVILAVISVLAWRLRKRSPCVLMGWLWFLGMLVPVIGLVQVGEQAMADRYTYLPAVGLFVAVVFGVIDLFSRLALPKTVVRAIAVLVLVACVVLTEYQLSFWRDTEALFNDALAVTRNNGPAHMMLGVWLEREGRQPEALREYQHGLDCDDSLMVQVAGGEKRPLAAHVQLMLGQAAEQWRKPNDAVTHYREALRLDSTLVEAYNNLGNALDAIGKPEEALESYQSAVRLQPNTPLVHENLGTQLVELRRFDEAMKEYEEASRLAPGDPRPFYLMGKAWLRRGDSAKAIAQFQTALEHNPNDFQSLTYLARVLASDENPQIRDGQRAIAVAERANAMTLGRQPFVLGSLAMAYAEVGRFDDARRSARTASLFVPTNTETFSNLQLQLRLYESNRPYRENFSKP